MGQKFTVLLLTMTNQTRNDTRLNFRQDEYVKGWQSALKKAHHTSGQKSVISCGCRGKGAKRLYVRSLPNSDTFILIKAANTGTEHDPSCVFFDLDARHTGLRVMPAMLYASTMRGPCQSALE